MKIRDLDNGYKALVQRVFELDKSHPAIAVGILAAQGAEQHGDDDLTVIQIAIWNEFGTDKIPARSFIRAWFDENEKRCREQLAALLPSVVSGQRTKAQVLELLGVKWVGEIQARIAAGIDPANAESTIARKGSSKPLIDTGVLRSSISYKVGEAEDFQKDGGK